MVTTSVNIVTKMSVPPSSITTIDRILNTVHTMLTDRGYTITPKSKWKLGVSDVTDLKAVGECKSTQDTVFVYFVTSDPKVQVKTIREYKTHMDEHKVRHSIIVYASQITSSSNSEITSDYDIETFKAKELFENPTRHCLVPKHEKIKSDADVQKVLDSYNLTSRTQLPRYDPSDIIVRYYHWELGSVVRIFRRFGKQREPEIYYRHVRDVGL